MDYFDFFHPPFSSLATIVANGLSVNQILLRRSPPLYFSIIYSTFGPVMLIPKQKDSNNNNKQYYAKRTLRSPHN